MVTPVEVANDPTILKLRKLRKVFRQGSTPVVANDSIDLTIRRKTIHAIIGENGAGKSTVMKMVYGLYPPDSGQIIFQGQEVKFKSALDAIEAKIGMVHQHFMLSGPNTALDNVILGMEHLKSRRFLGPLLKIDRDQARKKLNTLCERYRFEVDWDQPVERLPVGVQQRVEILKLLYRDSELLILDEPTAVLTPQETDELFARLRELTDSGKTVIVITHKLREVMRFADHVTVFRAGRVVKDTGVAETTVEQLAEAMVGRKVISSHEIVRRASSKDLPTDLPAGQEKSNLGERASPARESQKASLLQVKDLFLDSAEPGQLPRIGGLSFEVKPGEIVGIAGVEGNGQSELIECLLQSSGFGSLMRGQVLFNNKSLNGLSAREVRAQGVSVIAEDRHRQALLLNQNLLENFLLGQDETPRYRGFLGSIRTQNLRSDVEGAIRDFEIRPQDVLARAENLSGGNQQKLVVARELASRPCLLVAAQPTRGVDIGAIELLHRAILSARDQGLGVLLLSSELDEILALSDRIIVLYRGKSAGEFERGRVSERELGLAMGGGAKA
jgi:ABC-type uncharacterized transport system ATPase subunit